MASAQFQPEERVEMELRKTSEYQARMAKRGRKLKRIKTFHEGEEDSKQKTSMHVLIFYSILLQVLSNVQLQNKKT